jgi:hypothetical protein
VVAFFLVAGAFFAVFLVLQRLGQQRGIDRRRERGLAGLSVLDLPGVPNPFSGLLPDLPDLPDVVPGGIPGTLAGAGVAAGALAGAGALGGAALRPSDLGPPDLGPPQTPPPDGRPALDAVRDQAVVLQQHLPSRRNARSYWGGRPSLPPGVPWPTFTTQDGVERALSFVFQVSCAEVPAEGRLGIFPSRGLLLFFADLDWGVHWEWRVVYVDGEPAAWPETEVPATLPRAYGSRDYWDWPRSDDDWPRLLPRWSVTPRLLRDTLPPAVDEDEAYERRCWPGNLDVVRSLESIDGAIVRQQFFQNTYEDGVLVRPFSTFPHDWRAVKILFGHLDKQAGRGHLSRRVARGELTEADARTVEDAARTAVAEWTELASQHDPREPLPPEARDLAWSDVLEYQDISLFALTEAVNDSLDATLSDGDASLLPPEAVDLVRSRHALGSRGEHGLHVNDPDRLLAPPTLVQTEADERVDEWLLLLQLGSAPQLGHHFGEGVYQFWIRPEDLAARRFDRVELHAEAY